MPFNSASDAFELHPDFASYGTTRSFRDTTETSPSRSFTRTNSSSRRRARIARFDFGTSRRSSASTSAWKRRACEPGASPRTATRSYPARASASALPFYTLVPIRPRSRGERRSLRTLPGGVPFASARVLLSSPRERFPLDARPPCLTDRDSPRPNRSNRQVHESVEVGTRAVLRRGGRVVDATRGRQVRSIHWSPYDRVGVVNADP